MNDENKWKKRASYLIAPSGTPGVWLIKGGGFYVRTTVVDPTTGRIRELKRVFRAEPLSEVVAWIEREQGRVRAAVARSRPPRQRFAEFAASLFEEKIAKRDIKSAKGRQKWADVLTHLIAGTKGDSGASVAGFGDMFVDAVHRSHVEEWQLGVQGLINASDYAPTTANTWLAVLRVVMKAAVRKFDLDRCPTDGIDDFDTSEWETYSFEQPNSLTPEEVPRFLERLRELHPAHYAMAFLGFATGLRPSSLRPLRRRGEQPDIVWETGRMYVRRSHSRGGEIMNTTKQGRRYVITLPRAAVDVLDWHVRTQLRTPEQEDSDLLFPSVTGGYRTPNVLNKPFAEVAADIGLGKRLSQRGMRRTYNDLARAAEVDLAVLKSVSGHMTDDMVLHYSTVAPEEQQRSIGKVINLMERRPAGATSTGTGG